MAVSKVHNGTSFVTAAIKVWNGTAWIDTPAYYDGAYWVPLYPASGVSETVTLSGTTGAPNVSTVSKVSPTDANAGFIFNSDGTIDTYNFSGLVQFAAGVQWIDQTPSGSYWIRATANAGNGADTGTYNTWLALTTNRSWLWTITGIGTTGGSVKIEIATDAAGATIVATGYYGGSATVEP